ncbi:hypothetical protein MJ561_20370 [Klebsiella pneumoniae]|nr:hypothetical protein MJ561_20370 [Klebsiella pneumoniae]
MEKFCEPQVAIVSLTITEKRLLHRPGDREIDPDVSAHYSRSGESGRCRSRLPVF